MGRKTILTPYKVDSASSLGGNVTGTVFDVKQVDNVTVQANWSAGATPVGTYSILGSVDGTNFVAVPTTLYPNSTLAVSGNTGTGVICLTGISFAKLRVDYARTSGSATCDVWVTGRVTGG